MASVVELALNEIHSSLCDERDAIEIHRLQGEARLINRLGELMNCARDKERSERQRQAFDPTEKPDHRF